MNLRARLRRCVMVATLLGLVAISPWALIKIVMANADQPRAPVATTRTLRFRAVADTYVNARHPATNYGSAPQLSVDGDPIKISYITFEVSGLEGEVTSAVLRLRVVEPSPLSGGSLFQIGDSGWSESDMTFKTHRPVVGPALSTLGPVAQGDLVQFDATQARLHNGMVSFAISSDRVDGAEYASRETGDGPELIITLAPGTTIGDSPMINGNPAPINLPMSRRTKP